MDFGAGSAKPKAWKEVWGAGQGIGAVRAVRPAAALIESLAQDYARARAALGDTLARWPV
jgi:nitronate monooxygenase